MSRWVQVARVSDVPDGEARRVVVDRIEVALANLGDGTFLAVDDICSHAESSLSEGEVDPDLETIECPRHGSTFDLRTGNPKALPATLPVLTWPVRVEGEAVMIDLDREEV